MTDAPDDDLHAFELDAWAPPAPPAGIADAVIARVRGDAPSGERAVAIDHDDRRARWPWLVGAGAIAAAAAAVAVVAMHVSNDPRPPAPAHAALAPGELAAEHASHVELAGVTADLDAGASIRWRRDGAHLHVDQLRGAVTWTVAADDQLVIDAGAMVASVEATGASLRVEATMNPAMSSKPALTAAAALIAVTVFHGRVHLTSSGHTVEVAPGSTVDAATGEPPQPAFPVGALALSPDPVMTEDTVSGPATACAQASPEVTARLSTLDIDVKSTRAGAIESYVVWSDVRDPAVLACIANVMHTGHMPPIVGTAALYNTGQWRFTLPLRQPRDLKAGPPDEHALTADEIDRVVRAKAPAARACYQRALTRTPSLAGKLIVTFAINPAGVVRKPHVHASSTLHDDAVAACVIAIVGTLTFPASTGELNVNYPFLFSPAP